LKYRNKIQFRKFIIKIFDDSLDSLISFYLFASFKFQFSRIIAFLALLITTNKINKSLAGKAPFFSLNSCLDLNIEIVESQYLSSDDISSPEGLTIFWSKLITFFGNQFPEALVTDNTIGTLYFFQIILLLG
jgi:hypothetical protein